MAKKTTVHVSIKQSHTPSCEVEIMTNTARLVFADNGDNWDNEDRFAGVSLNASQVESLLGKLKKAAVMLRAAEALA